MYDQDDLTFLVEDSLLETCGAINVGAGKSVLEAAGSVGIGEGVGEGVGAFGVGLGILVCVGLGVLVCVGLGVAVASEVSSPTDVAATVAAEEGVETGVSGRGGKSNVSICEMSLSDRQFASMISASETL